MSVFLKIIEHLITKFITVFITKKAVSDDEKLLSDDKISGSNIVRPSRLLLYIGIFWTVVFGAIWFICIFLDSESDFGTNLVFALLTLLGLSWIISYFNYRIIWDGQKIEKRNIFRQTKEYDLYYLEEVISKGVRVKAEFSDGKVLRFSTDEYFPGADMLYLDLEMLYNEKIK